MGKHDIDTIFIVGAGAVGSIVATHLSNHGRHLVTVRTSSRDVSPGRTDLMARDADGREFRATVDTVSLDRLDRLHGLIVVSAKSYANEMLAAELKKKGAATLPLVVMQNGLDVEAPFLAAGFTDVYRCVVFAGCERQEDGSYGFRTVRPWPIGIVKGRADTLHLIVRTLDTPGLHFAEDETIQEVIWQKAIINAVFNSICPLLDVDNGIFDRDEQARALAGRVVSEGVAVAKSAGIDLDPERIMQQLLMISRTSTGQAISTLQDIRRGRQTEIASLNLEIARVGDRATPPVKAEQTRLLGQIVEVKAALARARAE